MISQAMREQIIEAALIFDAKEDFGLAPRAWPDSEFEAIEALAMNEEAIQRSAADWESLIEAAYARDDGDLATRLYIAQELLEM